MANEIVNQPTDVDVSNADAKRLFPLKLTPFEKFCVWVESPQQPMNSFIELHFTSPLNELLLEQSLTVAVHRNPMLASRVVEREGDLLWQYDPNLRIKLQPQPPLVGGRPVAINLFEETGVRFWHFQTSSGWRLLLQLHHACSDGVGIRPLLVDTMTQYTRNMPNGREILSEERAGRLEKVDVENLAKRFDFSGAFPTITKTLSVRQRIKNAHYFHFQLPTALKGSPDDLSKLDSYEPLRHAVLDRDLSEQVSLKARELELNINCLALAFLFQACSQWNQARGDKGNRRIRLLMPYDLRSRIDLHTPAANRLSFSFLGRTYRDCENTNALLASIQKELKDMKDTALPLDFLNALKLGEKYPRLMKWVIRKSPRMATSALTYAGDVMRGLKRNFPEQGNARIVGDSLLTNILAAPPVRENTNISLGLCMNWGQLCVSAAWNRDAISAKECEEFLSLYLDLWKTWL